MKMKFLAPVLAFAMVAGCSDKKDPEATNQQIMNGTENSDPKTIQKDQARSDLTVTQKYKTSSYTDKVCYAATIYFLDAETLPGTEGFERAARYYDNEVFPISPEDEKELKELQQELYADPEKIARKAVECRDVYNISEQHNLLPK